MTAPHHFKLGKFDCYTICEGGRTITFEEMFPDASAETLTAAKSACNVTSNEIASSYTVLLVDTGSEKILVDTGFGQGKLVEGLATLDLKPADITRVIITHSDGDHIGGIRDYPNAIINIPRTAHEKWTSDSGNMGMVTEFTQLFAEKAPAERLAAMTRGRTQYGLETLPSLKDQIQLVEAGSEIVPGITIFEAFGHRSDHHCLAIESGGATLIHVVDSIRHPIQVHDTSITSWIDSYPELIPSTNQMLIEKATGGLIVGAHIAFPSIGRITQTESGHALTLLS